MNRLPQLLLYGCILLPKPPRFWPVSTPSGAVKCGANWVRSCVKPRSRRRFSPLKSRFRPRFCITNPTRFFLNLFIPKHLRIFQLGSFGKNAFLYREFPRQSAFGAISPLSHEILLSCLDFGTFGQNLLGYFGRFGSFSFSNVTSCRATSPVAAVPFYRRLQPRLPSAVPSPPVVL